MSPHLLEVKDLQVDFSTPAGVVNAVRGVSFHVNRGEIVGLVGESGCGKSVTAQSILRLIPGGQATGQILLEGDDLLRKSEKELRAIRGNHVGMVFQDPMTSLNPTMRVGEQIAEGLRLHQRLSHHDAKLETIKLLQAVGINEPEKRYELYPFSLSGGMRQRVMIAIALACQPALLIADEPTTALDVTIQAQILELLRKLNKEHGTGILLITHDLGVVATLCERVIVMYAGQIMEMGTADQIFYNPQHPYTKALLHAIPKLGAAGQRRLQPIMGTPPDLMHPPSGCPFHPRCRYAMQVCEQMTPSLEPTANGQHAACWLHHPNARVKHKKFVEASS